MILHSFFSHYLTFLLQYLTSDQEGADEWISYRENVTNRWIEHVIDAETRSNETSCCSSDIQFATTKNGDTFCCPQFSMHASRQNVDGNSTPSRETIDNRITVGMTTCRRLPLFLRTMELLLLHIGEFPSTLIKEVLVLIEYFLLQLK